MASSDLAPIDDFILVVRDHRVILAGDLAKIYGVETRVLNQAVKRHREISCGLHLSVKPR